MFIWTVESAQSSLIATPPVAPYLEVVFPRFVPVRELNLQLAGRFFPEAVRTFTAQAASSSTYTTEERVGVAVFGSMGVSLGL